MNILVTGADGQLGRCLQDCLTTTGYQWTALGRQDLDITDGAAVSALVSKLKPDVIINAAAYTAVDKAESEQDKAWQINAEAVRNLATAANSLDALLIHVSTDYVFDGSAKTPYLETDPVNPLGVYGASKLDGELAARESNRHIIVRTAWVFSEYGNNFLKTMLRVGAERDELKIVADQVGTPTYAGDLAATLLRMAEESVASGIYHFSGGEACSWHAFADAIFKQQASLDTAYSVPRLVPIGTSDYPTPAKRPAYSVLNDTKLKQVLVNHSADWYSAIGRVIGRLSQN